MKGKNIFLVLTGLGLSAQVLALPVSAFNKAEYQLSTGLGETMPYAASALTDSFRDTFAFIEFDDDLSEKLVTYLDSRDRAFKEKSIQIRVREHVTKPAKSKITVKLRAPDPEAFGDISGYAKAEIDYNGPSTTYSVSYDLPYSPKEIDIQKVDINRVIDILKSDNNAWSLVSGVICERREDIHQTKVMRTYNWEGNLTDSRYDNVEIDFQIWTPYYRKPKVSFAEFSFKGKARDHGALSEMYSYLYDHVKATGLLEGAYQGSKTSATFGMSEGFE